MNKTDTALARRALLELWLSMFQDAIARQQSEQDRLYDLQPGEPIVPPPLIIPKPSTDMIRLLLSGIESALAGNGDPFMIRPPGKATIKSRPEKIEIVAELISEIDKRKIGGTRAYRNIAIDFVANRRGISADTLDAYLKDKDISEWAKLALYQKSRTKSGNRK
ncbi:MAG TPA: hypothetical protein PLU47_08035 [Azonexus sp.]|nr:hypothetical protein [Azonexus sp.]